MDPKQFHKLGRELRCQFVTGLSTLLLISFPLIWGSLRPGGLLQKEQAVYQLLYCDKSLGRAKGCFIGQADVTISEPKGYGDHHAGEDPRAGTAKVKPDMQATHEGSNKRSDPNVSLSSQTLWNSAVTRWIIVWLSSDVCNCHLIDNVWVFLNGVLQYKLSPHSSPFSVRLCFR